MTNEGSFTTVKKLERVKGIEPSYSAWKAAALPLSYTRARRRVNRRRAARQARRRQFRFIRAIYCTARSTGPTAGNWTFNQNFHRNNNKLRRKRDSTSYNPPCIPVAASAFSPAAPSCRRMRYPPNTTVRLPLRNTRSSRWASTAFASTRRSMSRPLRTRSSGWSACEMRSTSCSMIGPSSRSVVT